MARTGSTSVVKAAVSVTEMAKLLGMSRGHFYALIKDGAFPQPVYCVRTRRPMFIGEQQQVCLQVRATGVGVDGRYRLFYAERSNDGPRPAASRRTGAAPASSCAPLVEGLKSLGLQGVSEQSVASALALCFPSGTEGIEEGMVLRSLWQQIRRTNAA